MQNIEAKLILAALTLGATYVKSINADQHDPAEIKYRFTPGTQNMTPESSAIIQNWISGVLTEADENVLDGPNPHPDYSEFWVEVRPKTKEHGLKLPEFLPPKFRPYPTITPAPNTLPEHVIDISKSSLNILPHMIRGMGDLSKDSAFSEEQFFEITPTFAEMFPGDDAREPNLELSIKGIQNGKPVSADHYSKLLEEVMKNTFVVPEEVE